MYPIDIYECKLGDIVLIGDSYGMDVCVCVGPGEPYPGFNTMRFVDVITLAKHDIGYLESAYADDCYLISRNPKADLSRFR